MTEPLTPADLDLRDFPYMPLEVVRLRDSEVVVLTTGEEFRAAVMLWCAAWHQVPAASLPADDRLLANLAGFGRDLEAWSAVRTSALHGFIECSDGRLYHPVIAHKAIEAGEKSRSQRKRTEAATEARRQAQEKRDEQRNVARDDTPKAERNVHQGKGREEKGIEKDKIDIRPVAGATRPDPFDDFWKAYPRRGGENPKKPAKAIFGAAVKSGVDPETILAGAKAYAEQCRADRSIGTSYVAQALTWLRQARWDRDQLPVEECSAYSAKPGTPQFDAWKAHFAVTGSKFMSSRMRIAEDEQKPVDMDSEWPPNLHGTVSRVTTEAAIPNAQGRGS